MMAVLKFIGPPGSYLFIALGIAIGIFLRYVWPRRPLLACVWLLVLAASHLLLALPAASHAIGDALGRYPRAVRSPQANRLIVLDGDNRRGRFAAAIQAYEDRASASVIVLGDEWLVDRLVEGGVAPTRIRREPGPATTLEQMAWIKSYLDAEPGAAAVIASRLQMPRIAALAQALRIRIDLLPSPIDVEPVRTGIGRWIPSYYAMRLSRDAIYEHVALKYYGARGWIQRPN